MTGLSIFTFASPKAFVKTGWDKDNQPFVEGDLDGVIQDILDGIQCDPTVASTVLILDLMRKNGFKIDFRDTSE